MVDSLLCLSGRSLLGIVAGIVARSLAGDLTSANTMAEINVDTQDPNISASFPPRTGIKFDPISGKFEVDHQWIHVMIIDSSDLDGTSIAPSDFVVQGHTIQSVQWSDVAAEAGINSTDTSR